MRFRFDECYGMNQHAVCAEVARIKIAGATKVVGVCDCPCHQSLDKAIGKV